ncbi:MAG: hypothetical protein N2Z79_04570, partial [Candidatus Omnitrophica bacterium]|nr:hypothetical protein [Candidatus Omnitrophota bacterium]
LREEEERARNFRLRYTLDWTAYETGRRLNQLNQQYYSWRHGLNLQGPTPYGELDSSASIRSSKTTTDLTYFTLGLREGKFGPFKGFTLRGFDYSPEFSNLIFPGASLRGTMISSPIFRDKLSYTAFWGREGGGRYGDLSPGLGKQRHSFLEGFNLRFNSFRNLSHRFTLVRGWGRDRPDYLNDTGYDLESSWNFRNLNFSYEIAQDSETFAHLFKSRFSFPKISLITEFRNIDKQFLNILGSGWRQGEIGGLLSLNYAFTEKLIMDLSLDLYLDRLYPAQDNPDRLNENINWYLRYQLGSYSSLSLSYSLSNMLGKSSPYRYQNFGLGLSHTFKGWRDIYTYLNYNHEESKSFYSHSSDYINDRFYAGLRFNLIGEMYYYLNKEINFVEARFYAHHSRPHALDTGIGWSTKIWNSLYGNFRVGFRDEEDTVAPLIFLSGQDYLEGYCEVPYRASEDKEIYGSARFRNNWRDAPGASKGAEFDFNAGMRYLWDTGIKWESVGNIEGYVFKDFNSDGLRQKGEPAVEGIKIYLGKDKFQITDKDGHFFFKNVRARKVYLTLDTSTLPLGYVLTTPVSQEINIIHHGTQKVYFGITVRSEVIGYVFEDKDQNNEFNPGDVGVSGVIINLAGRKVVTDSSGRYYFSSAPVGTYTLTLELESLPVYYLPSVPIKKEIQILEGESLQYNFPLKRIKE